MDSLLLAFPACNVTLVLNTSAKFASKARLPDSKLAIHCKQTGAGLKLVTSCAATFDRAIEQAGARLHVVKLKVHIRGV